MATTLCPCGRWHQRVVCPSCGREAPPSRLPLWIGLGVLGAAVLIVLFAAVGIGVYLLLPVPPSAPPVATGPRPTIPAAFEPAPNQPPMSEVSPPAQTGTPPPSTPPSSLTSPLPTSPAPSPPKAPSPGPPAATGRLETDPVKNPRFKVGEAFDQEVVLSRRSTFRILGTDVATAAEYAFASRITIDSIKQDGSLTARQEVKETRLIDCDPTSRDALMDALAKAKGAVFSLTVGPDGVVTDLKGPKDPIRVLKEAAGGTESFRVWSLLDADGWKELAGLTFFRCDQPPKPGRTWTRGIEHNWGPLGSWTGRSTFVAKGPQAGAERIEYVHSLSYRPPGPGLGQGLPFATGKAEFRTPAAGGVMLYHPSRERVSAAEESFRVQGALAVSLAGSDVVVELEETQAFRLTIRQPSEPELRGQKSFRR